MARTRLHHRPPTGRWLRSRLFCGDRSAGSAIPADPDRGSRKGSTTNKAYRTAAAIRAQFAATSRRSERRTAVPDMVGSRLQTAMNGVGEADCDRSLNQPGRNRCQWVNPSNKVAQPISIQGLTNPNFVPGAKNSVDLVNFVHGRNGTFQVEERVVFNAIFSGKAGIDIGGGPIAYAFGVQPRGNDWSTRPINAETDLNLNSCFIEGDRYCVGTPIEGVGTFIFLSGTRAETQKQNVNAAFAGVQVPITEMLKITGAARLVDYGGSVGSTFNPKGTVRWEPKDWLVLRGCVDTTFRAPFAN